MAYVVPTSRADGYTVDAAEWNKNTVDNPIAIKAQVDGFVVEQTTTVTGGQDNFAPSAGTIVNIRCTGAAPNFTGFSGGSAGRVLRLYCLGTTLKVTDQATSTAANQIICESTQGQIVGVGGVIVLAYDDTTDRWRVVSVEPGTPITFTPTWTGSVSNPVINNGTLTGKYTQRGKLCRCVIRCLAGGSTTFGSGTYFWALPLTAADADAVRLQGELLDDGTAFWAAWSRAANGGTTTTKIAVATTGSTSTSTSDSVPMTWASGDQLVLGGEYEVA